MQKFNFYLDQKVTTWYRTNFEVEAEKKAIELYSNAELDEINWEQIDGTIELLPIEDNAGFSTAEIYIDNGTMIFDNTK